MSSDEIQQIMEEKLEDMLDYPEANEEVLQVYMEKVLREIRLWEE